jgi:hypothetical protein
MALGAPFLGAKRPGRETNHSPLLAPRSKNEWNYTTTPPIRLHGVVLSLKKTQGQIYIYLYTSD